MKTRKLIFSLCLLIIISISSSCTKSQQKSLKLATTTSTADTGLLDYLMPLFTTSTGHMIIVGGLTWMMIGVLIMRKMINFNF